VTFRKDNVDGLVDHKSGHAPGHKAEVEMHGCDDFVVGVVLESIQIKVEVVSMI
jgi:hypothetical protein